MGFQQLDSLVGDIIDSYYTYLLSSHFMKGKFFCDFWFASVDEVAFQ